MSKLTNQQIWNGASLSVENAQELYSVAESLGKDKIFGLASSLMVLSSEESIKAFGLLTRGILDKKWGVELQKYFKSHKHKHDNAGFFLTISSLMEEIIDQVEKIENDPNIPPEECKSIFFEKMKESVCYKLATSDEKLMSIVNWQTSADDIKKQGFYVDFDNGKWSSPNDIDEHTYIQQRDFTFNLLRKMQYILESTSIEELEKNIIKNTSNVGR